MSTRTVAAFILVALVAGCSASPTGPTLGAPGSSQAGNDSPGDDAGSSGGGPAGAAGSASGSGSVGGASSGGSASGSAGVPSTKDAGASGANVDAAAGHLFDAAPPPDADVAETITLTADAFTVAPGAEVYKCQTFANPFGKDVDLILMDGTMSAGSHHFFLFNMAPSTGRTQPTSLVDCPDKGLEFHPFPYLSQQPHWVVSYPEANMGYPLSAQNSLMINAHFLNTGATAIQAKVSITLSIAKPGVVTTHVGTVFLNNSYFSVPPTPMTTPVQEPKTWTPSGQLPANYTIFTSWSHMHRWGLDFTASAGSGVFYEEKNWDSPPLFVHNPPIAMTGSQSITWTCSYYNDTGSTLTFGDSAQSNVMCIYLGQYYPASPSNPDILVSQ